jgi:hypothetical protein
MEGDNARAFAGSDVQMASSLRFSELPAKTGSASRQGQNGKEVAATGQVETRPTRVAGANPGEDSDNELQSASDLR